MCAGGQVIPVIEFSKGVFIVTWLILILVLALVIGPVMYLVPSKKDKRLSGLRELARIKGISVKISSLLKVNPESHERVSSSGHTQYPKVNCVLYGKSPKVPLLSIYGLDLLRVNQGSTIPLTEIVSGWAIEEPVPNSELSPLVPSVLQQLAKVEKFLPQDCLGLHLSKPLVGIYWLEKSTAQ